MIITSWSLFRRTFALVPILSCDATFAMGAIGSITIVGPCDFVVAGFLPGMKLDITGTADNDGRYTINTVAAHEITLVSGDTLIAEGPVLTGFTGCFRGADGVEEFPSELSNHNLVRQAGFTSNLIGFSGYGTTMVATVNAFAQDTIWGVSDYQWFISQRTEVPANQHLDIVPYTTVIPGATYSGTILITYNALAQAELNIIPGAVTPLQVLALYRFVHAYVRRVADGAIQYFDLERIATNG